MKVMYRIHNCFFSYYMIMIVISFALVKFYAFAILYVLTVMQIKLVVFVVVVVVVSLLLKIELISDTNAQLIQSSITSYHKNQKRTRKKRERKKGKIIDHMTERKRRQNRVAAFLCKAE